MSTRIELMKNIELNKASVYKGVRVLGRCGLASVGLLPLSCASANQPASQASVLPSELRVESRVQAQVASQPQVRIKHEFVFTSDKKLKSVAVAGTFNNWNKDASPMKADADGTTWRLSLPIDYGKHTYKFVLDGETWILDPKSARNENDGNGNTNSVLIALPPDYQTAASPNDGRTSSSALLHLSRAPYFNYDRGKLALSLRVRPNDFQQIRLRSSGRLYSMQRSSSDELYALYTAELPWDKKQDLSYTFELTDGTRIQKFGANGLAAKPRPFQVNARTFQPYTVPGWVEQTVFYQIFPDRFANGDKSNDPKDVVSWNTSPQWFNRFGGDVAGVRQHVSHLVDLGISSVYFNPVFQAPSNHRYDAEDFKKLDPQFGTNAEFAALTRELQKQKIRTVLDFVFNHTATTFAPFQDIRQKGAASTYKDWYFIKSYPVKVADPPNYEAWFNYPSMPKLNLMNPPTGDYMLNLVDYWKTQIPLAGLRLDVANEVDPRFWRRLRTRVKGLDSQMWIVGEVWGDGSPWLGGDQWDSVMNYQFRDACLRFFADGNTSSSQFTNRLMQVHKSYAPQVSRNMMNLLSSHDTPRFLTLCKDDAALHQLAATVQFTWVGAPSIYYGEEIGMQGGADPDNRRGMRWDLAKPDNKMLQFYQRLIKIRNRSRALQSGDPSILLADDAAKTVAYARTIDNDIALVALNRSDTPQTLDIPLPQNSAMAKARTRGLVDALSGKQWKTGSDARLKMELAPKSSAVLLPASNL
jgi:glycosidase